eukprot:scaffold940_cov569-Prasinococcus_capsulatus_cf.AAC.2
MARVKEGGAGIARGADAPRRLRDGWMQVLKRVAHDAPSGPGRALPDQRPSGNRTRDRFRAPAPGALLALPAQWPWRRRLAGGRAVVTSERERPTPRARHVDSDKTGPASAFWDLPAVLALRGLHTYIYICTPTGPSCKSRCGRAFSCASVAQARPPGALCNWSGRWNPEAVRTAQTWLEAVSFHRQNVANVTR